jgi:hypothetical protein
MGTSSRTASAATPDAAALDVLETVPHIVKATFVTAISYALWEGVNWTIGREKRVTGDTREIAAGYRNDCVFMVVLRLAQLLDSDPKVVSFQRVYRHLKRPEVVTVVRRRVRAESVLSIDPDIRASVRRFLRVYRTIDWEVHGRLTHFRNLGVAHLTAEEIKRRVTYRELRSFVRLAVVLAECLAPFAPRTIPFRKDEIPDWSARARAVWRTAFRTSHKDRLRLMNR